MTQQYDQKIFNPKPASGGDISEFLQAWVIMSGKRLPMHQAIE